ncbi:hypothetical protein ACGFY3_21020 [Streptomyces mirabilis]|uniref:hypothetical protein n=1 Tax=Streptomyces mirabilis TaxID=68239 RepID=UPI003720F327
MDDELDKVFQLYTNGHDLHDPYLSPLFGDFTKGFPSSRRRRLAAGGSSRGQ